MAKALQKPDMGMKKLRNFSESDIEAAFEGFQVFNEGNQAVSLESLKSLLDTSGISSRYPTVYSIIAKINESNPKGLNFKSFMEAFQGFLGNGETKPGAKKLFETLDIESKEYLDKERLSSLAQEIGENISRSDLEYLISTTYNCPDGKVNSEAFQKRLLKVKNGR
jgi:Ca2+-binding EF-hand superfamily protein